VIPLFAGWLGSPYYLRQIRMAAAHAICGRSGCSRQRFASDHDTLLVVAGQDPEHTAAAELRNALYQLQVYEAIAVAMKRGRTLVVRAGERGASTLPRWSAGTPIGPRPPGSRLPPPR
jgi:hypothetical protein